MLVIAQHTPETLISPVLPCKQSTPLLRVHTCSVTVPHPESQTFLRRKLVAIGGGGGRGIPFRESLSAHDLVLPLTTSDHFSFQFASIV
jgi:hypothetical protein